MATNPKLIKDWIQYLKNNQIVDLKSDPATGKLTYKRSVTADDVSSFLELKTDYTEEEISNALHMVLSKKAIGKQPGKLQNKPTPSSDLSTWHHSEMRPGERPPQPGTNVQPTAKQAPGTERPGLAAPQQANQLGHSKVPGATDIDYKDVPDEEPKKPGRFRQWLKKRGLKEDINDEQGYVLDEKDVEAVFTILSSAKAQGPAETPKQDPQGVVPSQRTPEEKIEDVNKIKRLVRDTMSDAQRKAFWRALTDA